MPILKTSGVNYDIGHPEMAQQQGLAALQVSRARQTGDLPLISTLHLRFSATGTFDSKPVNLISDLEGCGSACRGAEISDLNQVDRFPVDIVRFAKQGTVPLETSVRGLRQNLLRFSRFLTGRSASLKWLVTMEEGKVLTGGVERQTERSVHQLRLAGRMIMSLQIDDRAVLRLESRQEPILQGDLNQWPPRDTTLKLLNPPISYFLSDPSLSISGRPLLVINTNEIHIGREEVALLRSRPSIVSAAADGPKLRHGGGEYRPVSLRFAKSSVLVPASEPQPTLFKLYRRIEGDDTNGWTMIASLPISQDLFTDEDAAVGRWCEYALTQAAVYNFGYHYESLVSKPVRIPG